MDENHDNRKKNENIHPAQRLLLLRQTLGFNQREMAQEFQVSSAAIACWELGTRVIPAPVIKLIDLYEGALSKKAHAEDFSVNDSLQESFKSAQVHEQRADLQNACRELQRGVADYISDISSINSLDGRLKQILIGRLLKYFKNSKGLFAKIMHLASFMELGLPLQVRNALGTLQYRSDPLADKVIRKIIEEQYGKKREEIFATWREIPLAVTSLGQVHYAKLRDGSEVAVKVQHPNIKKTLEKQLDKIEFLHSLVSGFGKKDSDIIPEIRRSVLAECDYHQEALNQAKFRNIVSEIPGAVVPKVYHDLVRDQVLVAEFIQGECFQSFASRAPQAERNRAAEVLIEALSTAAFGYGFTCTDLHPGNFLFSNGCVVFLDFGRVINYPKDRLENECLFYLSMYNRDYQTAKKLATNLFAQTSHNFDFDAFWTFMQQSHIHLLKDGPFKFTRDYAKSLSRQGRNFSKKYQLKLDKNSFWGFVFGASTWGLLADLEANLNLRTIAIRTTRLGLEKMS